jgi:hypothetical protein
MSLYQEVSKVLKKAPYDLIVFFLFALAIVTFSFYLQLDCNKELKASLIPYTGWLFGNCYMFPAFYIPLMLIASKASEIKTLILLRGCVLLLMLLQVYDGIRDYLSAMPEDYVNPNPYLRYDALTPIYTIAVPSFWGLLMLIMLGVSYINYRKAKAKI